MARFSKEQFQEALKNIELGEVLYDDFPWISVGILEVMFDDDAGYISEYFETPFPQRRPQELIEKIFVDG